MEHKRSENSKSKNKEGKRNEKGEEFWVLDSPMAMTIPKICLPRLCNPVLVVEY